VGRLLRSAADLNVQLRASSAVVRLIEDGGRVCGAVVAGRRGARSRSGRGAVSCSRAGGFPARSPTPVRSVSRRCGAPDTRGFNRRQAMESASANLSAGRIDTTLASPGAWVSRFSGTISGRDVSGGFRTLSNGANRASSACLPTADGSVTRATATMITSLPCSMRCHPGRRSHRG